MRVRRFVAVSVLVLLGISACGSSAGGSSGDGSSASSSSTTGSAPASRSATTTTPTLTVPPGSVAIVAGMPITLAQFNHWELVAAKSQAAQTPGQAVMVPDPPRFAKCIAAERKANPGFAHRPADAIRSLCSQLFNTLSSQVLAFLIEADWYRDEGARQGVTPSAAKVDASLKTDKQQSFPTPGSYQAFLRKTGQSDADIRLRLAVQLTLKALEARHTGSQDARATAVNKEVTRIFRPQTMCAAQYAMRDCSNYRSSAP